MALGARETVTIGDGARLETVGAGAGQPVVVVQTALTADELLPLTEMLAQGTGFRVIHVGRRGYGTSSPAPPGTTMSDMAVDCRDAIRALGIVPSDVVGVSFSCVPALALAMAVPSHVRSLTLVEPPPLNGPEAEQFRAATAELVATAQVRGPGAALEEFMATLYGPAWPESPEFASPGARAALERYARTFFTVDLPALLACLVDRSGLAGVRCPVLPVGGREGSGWGRRPHKYLARGCRGSRRPPSPEPVTWPRRRTRGRPGTVCAAPEPSEGAAWRVNRRRHRA